MEHQVSLSTTENMKSIEQKKLSPLKIPLKKKTTLRDDFEILNGGIIQLNNKSSNEIISLEVKRSNKDQPHQRKDKFGIHIKKNSKNHRISFKSDLVETIEVESYKELYFKLSLHLDSKEKVVCECTKVCLIV